MGSVDLEQELAPPQLGQVLVQVGIAAADVGFHAGCEP